MLNATVGKRSMAVIPLKEEDMKCLKEEAKKTAGIYFKQSRTQKTAKGVVLSFDWDKIRKDAGIEDLQKRESIFDRVRLARFMYENLKNYKKYVSVIKEIALFEGESPDDFAHIGVNPWRKIGLWDENCKN